jgi:hypothetical protein
VKITNLGSRGEQIQRGKQHAKTERVNAAKKAVQHSGVGILNEGSCTLASTTVKRKAKHVEDFIYEQGDGDIATTKTIYGELQERAAVSNLSTIATAAAAAARATVPLSSSGTTYTNV